MDAEVIEQIVTGLSHTFEKAVELAWLDGLRTGLFAGVIVGLFLGGILSIAFRRHP